MANAKEIFKEFLKNLQWFLDDKDLTKSESVVLVYVQEPTGSVAKGVVKIAGKSFTFTAILNERLNSVELDSKAFHFYLKLDDIV